MCRGFACIGFACIGFAFGYSFCRWRKWKKVFPSVMLIDLDKGQIVFDKPMPPECSIKLNLSHSELVTTDFIPTKESGGGHTGGPNE